MHLIRLNSLLILLIFGTLTIGLGQDALELRADELTQQEDFDRANQFYAEVSEIYFRDQRFQDFLRAIVKWATNLQDADEDEVALDLLEKSLLRYRGPAGTILADAYHKMGVSHYWLDGDDLTMAIDFWGKALKIREKELPSSDVEIIRGYNNIGNAYTWMENFDSADHYLNQALDLNFSREVSDTLMLYRSYRKLGDVYTNSGKYAEAESYLLEALVLAEVAYGDDPELMGECYTDLFELYYLRDETAKAKEVAIKGLAIYENMSSKTPEIRGQMADFQNNLGLYYLEIGELEEARRYLYSAADINRELPARETNLAINLHNISEIYLKRGDYEPAIRYIDQAIALNRRTQNRNELAEDYIRKANIQEELKGDLQSALRYEQEALLLFYPEFASYSIERVPVVSRGVEAVTQLSGLLSDKASTLMKIAAQDQDLDLLKKAAITFDSVAVLLDQVRISLQSDESKRFFAKKAKTTFEKAIDANFRLYRQEKELKYLDKCFAFSERSKAIILLDALNEDGARNFANIPDDFLLRETQVEKRLARINYELQDAEVTQKALLLNEKVLLQRRLEKLIDTMNLQFPAYARLKYNVDRPSIRTLQESLDRTVIEYFVGQEKAYAFVINSENAGVFELPLSIDLKETIQELRIGLVGPRKEQGSSTGTSIPYSSFVEPARLLYDQLFLPIKERSGIPFSERLLIIPDGALGYVPFEVLLVAEPKDQSLYGAASYDYLLEDYQVSYCYSAALYLEMTEENKVENKRGFGGFAPDFQPRGDQFLAEEYAGRRSGFGALRFNQPEVLAIQRLTGGKVFLGREATKARFLSEAPKFNLLHLATHGYSGDQISDNAYLVFDRDNLTADYGYLYNHELYNLRLNVDMVVLSACDTGVGELQEGEGIISLARGFSYAGVKSIITTLWSVDDESTKVLMESFYRFLQQGMTKDEALYRAKRSFLQDRNHEAHPRLWAALVAVGDMEPVETGGSKSWLVWALLPIVAFGFWLARRVYTSNSRGS